LSRRKSPLLGWLPVSLLLLSLGAHYNADSLLAALGLASADGLGAAWIRGVQVLAWLFGAALFNQLTRWLLWQRIVERAIGGPVPGVLKEIVAARV